MQAYCLFCDTVKCQEIADFIRRKFGWETINPRIVQRKWVKGAAFEEIRTLLPGYIFVYTEDAIEFPRASFRLDNVYRLLGDADANYTLQGDDYKFAMMLYNCGGTIGILKAYQEGDRVKLVKDALGGIEGEIVRLDRRKGRAEIQYRFAGSICRTWVGYDLIEGNDKVDLGEDREQVTGNSEQGTGQSLRQPCGAGHGFAGTGA